jgi:uncharacterized protein involved in propanediol utilization
MIGVGIAYGHHGELLQGMFSCGERLSRGLITLPCPLFWSRATFQPGHLPGVNVTPAGRQKARRAAELTLAHFGVQIGGSLCLHSNIPARIGLGSSTADVTATIRAVTACLGKQLTAEEIARFAVATEIAADSTMFGSRAVLFAQREGAVIEDFGCEFPMLEVLGFNSAPRSPGIDTLEFTPATYSAREIALFDALRAQASAAIRAGDAHALGEVASASARINQAHLPIAQFEQLEGLTAATHALGLVIAHSGTVAGLLFDPQDDLTSRHMQRARSLLKGNGYGQVWRFRVSSDVRHTSSELRESQH